MAEKILMLALSPTMETGTIVKWLKKEGESIASGDILCEVETDKATMDYESTYDGNLLKIVAQPGTKVRVGEAIAIGGTIGENIEPLLLSNDGRKRQEKEKKQQPVELQAQREPFTSSGIASKRIKVSPLAKELAIQKGIDLQQISGSGPGGRIIRADVEKGSIREKGVVKRSEENKNITKAEEGERVPLSEKRRVIAQRLSESMFTAPHYYVSIIICVDMLLTARNELNRKTDQKISLNAFFIKFVAEALKKYAIVNSSWGKDAIIYHKTIDISLAVALEDGLITPVVRNCGQKGIIAIDNELKGLVDRARQGKLGYEEYSNSTFTISNLGSFGIRNFTAIINPPESAILAVGEVFREPYVDEKEDIKVRNSITMTLSCDHRVIDGAIAADFAKDLKNLIERPVTVLY